MPLSFSFSRRNRRQATLTSISRSLAAPRAPGTSRRRRRPLSGRYGGTVRSWMNESRSHTRSCAISARSAPDDAAPQSQLRSVQKRSLRHATVNHTPGQREALLAVRGGASERPPLVLREACLGFARRLRRSSQFPGGEASARLECLRIGDACDERARQQWNPRPGSPSTGGQARSLVQSPGPAIILKNLFFHDLELRLQHPQA